MKPILKLYRGYANEQELIVMGHVFKPTSTEDYNFQKRNLKNARSVIKLFSAKIQANADVYLEHNDLKIHTKTLEDGYFKITLFMLVGELLPIFIIYHRHYKNLQNGEKSKKEMKSSN